jgi:4-hydroxymandelate oxidase
MNPDVADFLEGGAGTERTLRANREAFTRWMIRPRPMSGVYTPDTATTFLGIPLAVPILTAPFGGDGLFGADGHLAVARANQSCGTASIVPEAGTYSYEQVAAAAPTAAKIAQVHPLEHFGQAIERIKAAGYDALCVTIDCPVPGFRGRNRVNRFNPDWHYFAGNLVGGTTPNVAEMFGALMSHEAPAWNWERLAAAAAEGGLPWMAKGVLTGASASAAISAGASAVLVSNHGGRQLDPAPASLDALPEVVEAVAGRVHIAFDSGIRTGADVFTALALGADVVVIGRLAAYGLAAGGESGVRRTIELLTEELRTLMILAGIPDIAALDATAVGR